MHQALPVGAGTDVRYTAARAGLEGAGVAEENLPTLLGLFPPCERAHRPGQPCALLRVPLRPLAVHGGLLPRGRLRGRQQGVRLRGLRGRDKHAALRPRRVGVPGRRRAAASPRVALEESRGAEGLDAKALVHPVQESLLVSLVRLLLPTQPVLTGRDHGLHRAELLRRLGARLVQDPVLVAELVSVAEHVHLEPADARGHGLVRRRRRRPTPEHARAGGSQARGRERARAGGRSAAAARSGAGGGARHSMPCAARRAPIDAQASRAPPRL
eukprot:CAMPEP_0204605356 /NCGR_PEP_ID=MMETSP0661-20131031/58434_1 /ASSEMBLY_ACC=CAM_ASM_000606 /TAXON_ID=109239 /ORGANISM="Alexandrium margalefi, Strain AMGDE01CS-322" /LENGTH=270 /DNA_ID=CAMNT_0051616591 /DNA_START=243 /DNA_END=1052 /DNA_ORIENTATION=-